MTMNDSRSQSAESSVANTTISPASAGHASAIKLENSPESTVKKKRPGPKRDAKPALSEKLERNRQAQRTHRERKEQYTKDLEAEVMRLRELFVQAAQERDSANQARDNAISERNQLFEENQRLKEQLSLSASVTGTDSGYSALSISNAATRSNSIAMSEVPTKTSRTGSFIGSTVQIDTAIEHPAPDAWEESQGRCSASSWPIEDAKTTDTSPSGRSSSQRTPTACDPPAPIDYDELGLDFVLTLERPCMGHLQYLTLRAHNCQSGADYEMGGQPMEVPDDGENQHISGHALMITAPSQSHIHENPGVRYPAELPKLQREDLVRLLDLSSQLQVSAEELPPVKAWLRLMQDERLKALREEDFAGLKAALLRKVHCYRFGAVVTEGDIADALQEVLDGKFSPVAASSSSASTAMQS